MDDRAFAEWLLREGLLTPDGVRRALEAQRSRQGRLDTEILDLGLMGESALLAALGRFHRSRTVAGPVLEFASPTALRMITPRIASRLGVVPFKLEGKTLSVATLSPGELLVEDEIAQQTGCMVASFVALEVRFVEALHRHYAAPISTRYAGLLRRLSGAREGTAAPASRPLDPADSSASAPPPPSRRVGRSDESRAARPPGTDSDELELSADELDLFPSLREAPAETATAGADSRPESAQDEAAPPGAPRADTQPVECDGAEAEPGPNEAHGDDPGPEGLLVSAALAMQNAEMRDDIADAMLGFCQPLFRRRMMLVLRRDTVIGWRGEGEGVDQAAVRAVRIPASAPSVFSGLLRGVEFWLGPLPDMPRNAELALALGEPRPRDCYILPVRLKDKPICFLYGDNLDAGVGGLPLGELKRLAAKAGLAFQVYLLKGKIRRL
ncbi:MAG TPA: hypothetical protein VLB51_00560 [Methylomirabilota bacterium]|nr:hypothetical protein [Methylomirabilota bacterium]